MKRELPAEVCEAVPTPSIYSGWVRYDPNNILTMTQSEPAEPHPPPAKAGLWSRWAASFPVAGTEPPTSAR